MKKLITFFLYLDWVIPFLSQPSYDSLERRLDLSIPDSSIKELTDINVLCDEYLRLCYHGLRAKDKSLDVTLNTTFDVTVEKISIIPQDIGRVLLNLYNNAICAVNEKKNLNIDKYQPGVSLSTKKTGDKVEIRVKDNGNGIPQNILDKIFQPVFATKPTAEGPGLGLSLSYDIIKAHGAEMKVDSKENDFAEFIVILPIYTKEL